MGIRQNNYIKLGYTYCELGKLKEAMESFKQAIRINPDLANAHFNLGIAYVRIKDRDSAFLNWQINF
jgi:tetratricopeptide (TPR) repeat protein